MAWVQLFWSAFTIGTRSHGQHETNPSVRKIHGGGGLAGYKSGVSPEATRRRSLIDVEPRDFDDREMRTTFKQILSRITRIQDGQVGSIAATCRQMSDQEAAEVADFIFSLFLTIAEKYHSSA
jgi:hypothetical protein